ncbi:MAG: hypothetical protein K6E48_10075 [Lachnospiraceae bacterium]|nr:hypothetical protein [Lachnospiraceae bacterium]
MSDTNQNLTSGIILEDEEIQLQPGELSAAKENTQNAGQTKNVQPAGQAKPAQNAGKAEAKKDSKVEEKLKNIKAKETSFEKMLDNSFEKKPAVAKPVQNQNGAAAKPVQQTAKPVATPVQPAAKPVATPVTPAPAPNAGPATAPTPSPAPAGPDAEFKNALLEFNKKNYQKAFSTFKRFAEDQNAEAQYMIGIMYYKGLGISQDVNRAKFWLESAAKRGHLQAAFEYGMILLANSNRTAQEESDGLFYMTLAGDGGYDPAQRKFVDLIKSGIGGKEEVKKAVEYCNTLASKCTDSYDAKTYTDLGAELKKGKREVVTQAGANVSSYAAKPSKHIVAEIIAILATLVTHFSMLSQISVLIQTELFPTGVIQKITGVFMKLNTEVIPFLSSEMPGSPQHLYKLWGAIAVASFVAAFLDKKAELFHKVNIIGMVLEVALVIFGHAFTGDYRTVVIAIAVISLIASAIGRFIGHKLH